jgi:rhomboid protease GluP
VAWVELIRYPSKRQAEELQFVLRGGGVPSSLIRVGANGSGPYHAILVPPERLAEAQAILEEEQAAAPAAPVEAAVPDPPRLYWVIGLIVVNVLLWIATEGQSTAGKAQHLEVMLRFGASQAPLLFDGQWWRTVTAVFLHFDLRHLLANMITLALLGPPALRAWRVGRFYTMYLLAGIAGNWISFALSPSPSIKAGASGAILGLLGVLAGTKIRSIRSPTVPSRFKVWHIVAMLVAFYGFVIGVGRSVDHLAHLGGLAVGLVLALVLPSPGRLEARRERALEAALTAGCLLLVVAAGLLAYSASR